MAHQPPRHSLGPCSDTSSSAVSLWNHLSNRVGDGGFGVRPGVNLCPGGDVLLAAPSPWDPQGFAPWYNTGGWQYLHKLPCFVRCVQRHCSRKQWLDLVDGFAHHISYPAVRCPGMVCTMLLNTQLSDAGDGSKGPPTACAISGDSRHMQPCHSAGCVGVVGACLTKQLECCSSSCLPAACLPVGTASGGHCPTGTCSLSYVGACTGMLGDPCQLVNQC
jgi:hypothetical protein